MLTSMTRAVRAPAFVTVMLSGLVLMIVWPPVGLVPALLGGLGVAWVIVSSYLDRDDGSLEEEPMVASDQSPEAPDRDQVPTDPSADGTCTLCGKDIWERDGIPSHYMYGPRPWERLRDKILSGDPGTPEGYIGVFVEETWATGVHRTDRLIKLLEHDLGTVPEDLEDRVYERVREHLKIYGAYSHLVSAVDDPGTDRDDEQAVEALADELAQHAPDPAPSFPVPLVRWLLDQEASFTEGAQRSDRAGCTFGVVPADAV